MASLLRDVRTSDSSAETDLRSWVRDHRVTWEMSPWQEMSERRVIPVGFEVRLFARYYPERWPDPGGHEGVALYEKLREIAVSLFPDELRPARYEINPFDVSLHLRPESGWSPEVQLSLHIEHREGYLKPVDECEKRCLDEIERGLKALGVQARSWSAEQTAILNVRERVPPPPVALP